MPSFTTFFFIFSALFIFTSVFPSAALFAHVDEEKRGFGAVRNPYSWMAQLQRRSVPAGIDDNAATSDEQMPNLLLDEAPLKRSPSRAAAFFGARRPPQNPYSWMSFGDADQSNMDWLITRLRPFSDLVSKRLNALGMGFRRPKSQYLWAINRQPPPVTDD